MRYSVLVDGVPLPKLAFLPDLADAKLHGEKLAVENIAADVQIDACPDKPGPMATWRFDREVNDWVEAH